MPEDGLAGYESSVFLDVYKNKLVIDYASEDSLTESYKPLVMDLPSEEDKELVSRLMHDVNFWTNFLQSMSAAITANKKV